MIVTINNKIDVTLFFKFKKMTPISPMNVDIFTKEEYDHLINLFDLHITDKDIEGGKKLMKFVKSQPHGKFYVLIISYCNKKIIFNYGLNENWKKENSSLDLTKILMCVVEDGTIGKIMDDIELNCPTQTIIN